MVVQLFLPYILIAATLFTISVYAQCENPSVRREWRQFSTEEKAEWISAVKVSAPLPYSCMLAVASGY